MKKYLPTSEFKWVLDCSSDLLNLTHSSNVTHSSLPHPISQRSMEDWETKIKLLRDDSKKGTEHTFRLNLFCFRLRK